MALSTYLSDHELYLFDTLRAILAWDMACIELRASTHLWLSGLSEQGYLQAWSDEILRLANDGFVPSWSSRALLMLLGCLPTLFSALGLALIGLFLRRLAKGERWSQCNARTLVHIGLLSFLTLLLQPFVNTLRGPVLSLDLSDGERVPDVSIGFTSKAAYEFLKAIFLCSFGPMMNGVRKLDEEVRVFI